MSHWKECKLGDVAEVQTGPFGSQLHQSDYKAAGTPIITVEHLGDNRIAHSNLPLVGDVDKQRLIKYILKEGDVVFSRVGSVDRCAYVHKEEDGWMFSGRLLRVRAQDNVVDSRFLSFYFSQESFKDTIRMIAVGATMPSINTEILSNVDIMVPSLLEQRAIAGVLSSLDDKIDLLHRQNKTLEGMAEALWRKMFVPACAGEPHADREEADSGWKKGKLGDIAEINPLRTIKKGANAIYLDMSNMPTNGPFPKEWIQREFTSGMKFKNGDTIIARITPCLENGKTAYVNFLYNGEIGWGSTEYIILAPPIGYFSEWYYFLARNDDFRDFAIQNMTGTSGRQRVSGDSIAQYEITIPPMNILEKFRDFAGPVIEHIKQNSFQIRTLSRLRDALLPKLVSGEIRVNNE
jgi:type I restriction enzyme S subunit